MTMQSATHLPIKSKLTQLTKTLRKCHSHFQWIRHYQRLTVYVHESHFCQESNPSFMIAAPTPVAATQDLFMIFMSVHTATSPVTVQMESHTRGFHIYHSFLAL